MTKGKVAFENNVGKGVNAGTSILSFSYNVLYPSKKNFQFYFELKFILSSENAFNLDTSKCLLVDIELTISQTSLGIYKSIENTLGKGEIARNEQFLLFPQCFLPLWRPFCHFHKL